MPTTDDSRTVFNRVVQTRVSAASMRRSCSILILSIFLAGYCTPLQADETPGSSDRKASPRNISRWIRDLDADRYIVRRTATENLIGAGKAAVEPVAKALVDANLEVSTLGILVLRELAMNGDIRTEKAAEASLQELAKTKVASASRLARESLVALAGVRQRRALKKLRELGAKIESSSVLTGFQQTNYLALRFGSAWQGQIEDLERLKWLGGIQEVSFDGQRFTDAWIRPVRYLPDLQRLVIRHAGITDSGLQVIRTLKDLQAVDLMYTPITDTGLKELQHATKLRRVRAYGTRITPAGVDDLKKTLAQVEIDYKRGAFLGVRCQQAPGPCDVTMVTPNSAAAKAGVQTGDTLVQFAGHAVHSFEDLRQLIAERQVGDTVTIQVARGGQRISTQLHPRKGNPLGLQAKPHPFGCQVVRTDKGSAAAEAGLRPDDIIFQMNQDRVTDFESITKLLTQHQADQPVAIRFGRAVKVVPLKVTFGEWQE